MRKTLRLIAQHPLTRDRPLAAVARFARWQIKSRLRNEVVVDWIDGARLAVRNGMTGATGNIYCGLHEFADMAFILHMLRPGDLFVDAGANVGSYTVLAGKVCGAEVVAVEPDRVTMAALKRNLEINGIQARVRTAECALGAACGLIRFTTGHDTTNRVATGADEATREVLVKRLDDLLAGTDPLVVKLDVEGYEEAVLSGAHEVLRRPSLLAVEVETDTPAVRRLLMNAGFEEVFYDPFTRKFGAFASAAANNSLFVRDRAACLSRLAEAPWRTIVGQTI